MQDMPTPPYPKPYGMGVGQKPHSAHNLYPGPAVKVSCVLIYAHIPCQGDTSSNPYITSTIGSLITTQ